MLSRSVTGPALAGEALVVGDYDGYVHWIDAVTGDLLAREKTSGRITNTPVAAGDLLLFQTDSGEVEAWRAARGADPADPARNRMPCFQSSRWSAGRTSASRPSSMR